MKVSGSTSCIGKDAFLILRVVILYPFVASAISHDVLFQAKKASGVSTFTVTFGNPDEQALKIMYFPLRGLADLPAMMLELTETPYAAEYVSFADFHGGIKQSLVFGRLPVLHVEGADIAQSGAIVRFLSQELGLSGNSPLQHAKVDMWHDTVNELFKHHSRWGKAFDAEALATSIHDATSGDVDFDVSKFNMTFKDTTNSGQDETGTRSLMVLNTFEAAFASKDSLHLVGDSVTYADLALFCQLDALAEDFPTWSEAKVNKNTHGVLLAGFPHLAEFKRQIENIPQIARFLTSHRRMPRVKRRDGEYYFIESVRGRPTDVVHDSSEL